MSAIVNNGPIHSPVNDIDDDEVDLGDLVAVLIENRWLILGVTLAAFVLGALNAFVATPIYKADVLIQVEEKRSGLGDLDISALFEGDTSVNAEIEILRSRLVLGAVVDNLKLAIIAEPDYFPIFGAALARRSASYARFLSVDTLDVTTAMIGKQLTLIAGSANNFELLDPNGEPR